MKYSRSTFAFIFFFCHIFIVSSRSLVSTRVDTCGTDTTYLPFVIDDVSWLRAWYSPFDEIQLEAYRIYGDTVIDNTLYKNIYAYGIQPQYFVAKPPYRVLNENHYGFIREDSARNVYLRLEDLTIFGCKITDKEVLLYNFGSKVGDDSSRYCDKEPDAIIESLYCETLFGYDVTNYDGNREDFYEAIGKLEHPFWPLYLHQTLENAFSFISYCRGNFQDCGYDFFTSVSDTDLIAKVFPNPTMGQLNINHRDPVNINVYDAYGRLLLSQSSDEYGRTVLDVENWSAGLYYYKISSPQSSTVSGRFLKQ
jgi:hypothetical protein